MPKNTTEESLRDGEGSAEAVTSRTAAENESHAPHSPLPWRADSMAHFVFASECGSDFPVLEIRGWGHLTGVGGLHLSDEEALAVQEANAAFIVTSVNSHDALLAACKTARYVHEHTTAMTPAECAQLEAAINLAEQH